MAGSALAVIIVDAQHAFCSPDGSVARQGRDIAACAAAAARCVDLAVAARAHGVPLILTRFVLRADYADGGVLIQHIRPGMREAGSLRAGTPDVELIPELVPRPEDVVIDKIRNSSFFGTPLDSVLRTRGVSEVLVAGLTTSMCVESTVRDAAQLDYLVHVPVDAVADFDQARHAASLRAMEFGFARLTDSAAAIARITGVAATATTRASA